ncbi:unnamed protein product [Dimorphilus gyrociliatus]|uniref:Uncharacterized protein n=1 Tax=Dimorphilus gyrociliatus TaxID=2664684 RepID=A0A7I8V4Y5_9ANNE|nr:unnamed protein product [Dimorphilus gyrociliatus]
MFKKSHLRFWMALMIIAVYVYIRVSFTINNSKNVRIYRRVDTRDWENCSIPFLDSKPMSIRQHYSVNFPYTCRNLIYKTLNDNDMKILSSFRKNYPRIKRRDSDFIELSKDCSKLKSLGYIEDEISDEELNFPLAFNMIVHFNAEQVERQLRALWRPHNIFCIHVDKSSPKVFHDAIRGISSCFNNVFVIDPSIDVVYAGFSRLLADIKCMELLLKSTTNWKYLMNTAGTAFPRMTNYEMVQVLNIYNGANDVEGLFDRPIRSRFEDEWIEVIEDNKSFLKKTGKKNPPPPDGTKIVRGSAYAIFSRNFVHYIINDEKSIRLLEWSRKTWSPDEHYWATLHHLYANPHLHTPGGYRGIPQKKPWLAVFAGWSGEYNCKGKWLRGVCVFSVSDLSAIMLKQHFFVNKFDVQFDAYALDCFEAWIMAKSYCRPKFSLDYYKTLPFIIE